MAYWPIFVVAIVFGLILYELIFWIRRKVSPPVADPLADDPPVDETQAELARATMKIAVLESRLEEAEIAYAEEVETLQAQYRRQVAQTEATYQQQMVVLSERLAANGKGNWKKAPALAEEKPREEYPVRMAEKVDAWRKGTGIDEAAADTAVAAEAPPAADKPLVKPSVYEVIEIIPGLGVVGRSSNGSVEASAPPEADAISPGEDWVMVLAQAQEAAYAPDDPALLDEADHEADGAAVTVHAPAEHPEVLAQTRLLDEDGQDTVGELDEAPDLEAVEVVDEDGPDGGLSGGEAVEAGEAEAVELESAEDEVAAADAAGDTAAGAAVAVVDGEDERDLYENRWTALEDLAEQRAMARQLGSEMDADYLDDDELLQEMGIAQEHNEPPAYAGETAEEMMGKDDWNVDPLEELANHFNGVDGQPQPASETAAAGEDTAGDPPAAEFADQDWEEMVYASAAAVQQNGSALEEPPQEEIPTQEISAEEIPVETVPGDEVAADEAALEAAPEAAHGDDEQAEIEATVAAILSRAPGQEADQASREADEQPPSDFDGNGNSRYEVADLPDAAEAAVPGGVLELPEVVAVEEKPAPELPHFNWQRQPIIWQAEYYDNVKLADEPVVVRQDEEIDFDWHDNPPAKGLEPRTFSVRWSGALPLDEGQYRFVAQAPDGLRLWLNGRLVISAWYDQSEQTYQREFAWPGGNIDVRLEHYENGGDARAFLTWDRVA